MTFLHHNSAEILVTCRRRKSEKFRMKMLSSDLIEVKLRAGYGWWVKGIFKRAAA
jgi:hypothetical protein